MVQRYHKQTNMKTIKLRDKTKQRIETLENNIEASKKDISSIIMTIIEINDIDLNKMEVMYKDGSLTIEEKKQDKDKK